MIRTRYARLPKLEVAIRLCAGSEKSVYVSLYAASCEDRQIDGRSEAYRMDSRAMETYT